MALGALMNSLASVNSAMSGIGSSMSSLPDIASSIGGALRDAVVAAKDAIVEKWNDLKKSLGKTWDGFKESGASAKYPTALAFPVLIIAPL